LLSEKCKTGSELLRAIKSSANKNGTNLVIPVGRPPEYFIRPIPTSIEELIDGDISALTDWRNRFVNSFLTEFVATKQQTTRWLVDYVRNNNSKIIFMVEYPNGEAFGYMGLDFIKWEEAYGEADSIVKGGHSPHGAMKLALQALLSWAQGQLGLDTICVRVRSDNSALEFYKKVGFHEFKRTGLRRTEEKNMIKWVEDISIQAPKVSLVYMKYSKE
jgi:RimJ/RimL family protein N-acetyltransferase